MEIELPLLRLGLAGFTAVQRAAIADALDDQPGEAAAWEPCDPGARDAADAWWLNGPRVARQERGRLRVAPAQAGEEPLSLDMSSLARPVAFALPLPRGLDAALTFDAGSQDSMHAMLAHFEAWLAPLRALFCLGAHLAERERPPGPGLYEVTSRGGLLAVVDMHGNAAVRPTVRPGDFAQVTWTRLHGPREAPADFCRASLAQVMWHYAARTQRDGLPPHYRSALLYWRRPPRLPQRVLSDEHLHLMRRLVAGPATFAELEASSGFEARRLARLLAGLYFVGCITSNPRRAAAAPRDPGVGTVQGGLAGDPGGLMDRTAPVRLRRD